MNKEATMTDKQLVMRLNKNCRTILTEMREIYNQHKDTLDEETCHYLEYSVGSEEHFFSKATKETPDPGHKPEFLSSVLWMLEHHKEYVLKICQEGMPEKKPYPPVTEYTDSVTKHLRDAADEGDLVMGEDKVYRITEKGRRLLARMVMFGLKGDRFFHSFDLWDLNGLRDDDERDIWSAYTYHNHFYWTRVFNAVLLTLTDEQLAILRVPRPEPLKVKVTVPVWVTALLPLVFAEARQDNLQAEADYIVCRTALEMKYGKTVT
jgi:hypothetical protein